MLRMVTRERQFYVSRFAPNCQLTGRSVGQISFRPAFFRSDIDFEILTGQV